MTQDITPIGTRRYYSLEASTSVRSFHSCSAGTTGRLQHSNDNTQKTSFRGVEADETLLNRVCVPLPSCEGERLRLLRETKLLDSLPNEVEYQRLANLAARIFKVHTANFITKANDVLTDVNSLTRHHLG